MDTAEFIVPRTDRYEYRYALNDFIINQQTTF